MPPCPLVQGRQFGSRPDAKMAQRAPCRARRTRRRSAIRSFGAEGSRLRGTHRREEQPDDRGRGSNSEASAGEDGSGRE